MAVLFTVSGVQLLHDEMHHRLDLVLDHAATIPPELFLQNVTGFGSANVRDQLVHILSVEGAWLSRAQGIPATRLIASDYMTVDDVVLAKQRVKADTAAYLARVDDAQLNTVIKTLPRDWSGPARSPGFIMHHVITHAFHHKGQVATMFRLLGYPIGDTDLQRLES
jgi:uncharacterized damage-inducible protein DinB